MVVKAEVVDGLLQHAHEEAIRYVGFKTAKYLGEAARDITPDEVHTYETKPLREQIQYKIAPEAEQPKAELPIFYQQLKVAQPDEKLMKECISAYETTYFLLKNGELNVSNQQNK